MACATVYIVPYLRTGRQQRYGDGCKWPKAMSNKHVLPCEVRTVQTTLRQLFRADHLEYIDIQRTSDKTGDISVTINQ